MCSRQFSRRSRLAAHFKTHTGERPYPCPFCPKSFASKGNCNTHVRVHTRERPYICPLCDKRFSQHGQMVIHVRRHTGEKPYVCTHCSKGFTCSKVLKIHVRTHTGEKPYICDYCTKGFAAYANLVVHRRIHTRERPYRCKLCGRAFEHSGNLVRHERGHHVDGGIRCIPCGKLFKETRELMNHMTSEHPYEVNKDELKEVMMVVEDSTYRTKSPPVPAGSLCPEKEVAIMKMLDTTYHAKTASVGSQDAEKRVEVTEVMMVESSYHPETVPLPVSSLSAGLYQDVRQITTSSPHPLCNRVPNTSQVTASPMFQVTNSLNSQTNSLNSQVTDSSLTSQYHHHSHVVKEEPQPRMSPDSGCVAVSDEEECNKDHHRKYDHANISFVNNFNQRMPIAILPPSEKSIFNFCNISPPSSDTPEPNLILPKAKYKRLEIQPTRSYCENMTANSTLKSALSSPVRGAIPSSAISCKTDIFINYEHPRLTPERSTSASINSGQASPQHHHPALYHHPASTIHATEPDIQQQQQQQQQPQYIPSNKCRTEDLSPINLSLGMSNTSHAAPGPTLRDLNDINNSRNPSHSTTARSQYHRMARYQRLENIPTTTTTATITTSSTPPLSCDRAAVRIQRQTNSDFDNNCHNAGALKLYSSPSAPAGGKLSSLSQKYPSGPLELSPPGLLKLYPPRPPKPSSPGPREASPPGGLLQTVCGGGKRPRHHPSPPPPPQILPASIRYNIRQSVLSLVPPPAEDRPCFKSNVEKALEVLLGTPAMTHMGYPDKNVEQVSTLTHNSARSGCPNSVPTASQQRPTPTPRDTVASNG